MEIFENENFIINYTKELENFVEKSVIIASDKKKIICEILNCENNAIGKLKASFFTDRESFTDYIRNVSDGATPPEWATGCFYNGEIQTLVNMNNRDDLQYKTYTLAHEMIHLYIEKFIYQKYKLDRIRWFDESYASFLDGHIENRTKEQLKSTCLELEKICNDFDMNKLNNVKKVKTKNYNGYDMFLIIGKYIFENNLAKKYIELLKTNPKEIIKIGKTILADAVKYGKTSTT